MKDIPEFLIEAKNVYRTKHFIVRQIISLQENCINGNELFSTDTYFKRTKSRDKQYNNAFNERINIDGKRLPSTAFSRNYID